MGMMDYSDLSKNFGQLSGINISKGESVIKALQKLWQKLQLLEQACQSKKANTVQKKNEATFCELQQKLLELQFRYVRKLLYENNDTYITCNKTNARKGFSENERITSSLHEYYDYIPVRDCCDKHTQTDSASAKFTNSVYSCKEVSPVGSLKNPSDSPPMQVASGATLKSDVINVGSKQRNSWTHYHLRLSDVPFIIGTSTSSHSVVANVQKIISMMKVHNRGLCSSVPNHPRRSLSLDFKKYHPEFVYPRTYSSPDLSEHHDLKNRLFSLSDELKALTLKLGSMKHPGNPSSDKSDEFSYMDYANTLNLIEMKTRQIIALHKVIRKHTGWQFFCKQHKSFSQASPCSHYPEKSTPSSNDTSVNRLSKTDVKQVTCSFNNSHKTDCFERRRMMRELKEVQVHLQREDIHWK